MTDEDIEAALKTIEGASTGPATWTHDPDEDRAEAVDRFRKAHDLAAEVTGTHAMHAVEIERNAGSCLVVAITGNGPCSAANARLIVGAMDPVAGWKACLLELQKMRAEASGVAITQGGL